jgi:Arc/MetJ family transcription regulator
MRTDIVLDNDLVKKALKLSKAKTKKDLVHEGIRISHEFLRYD